MSRFGNEISCKMPKRSDVWYHFTHQELGRATCNYCKFLLSYTGGSTGNLARHLKKKHPGISVEKTVVTTGTALQDLLSFQLDKTPGTNAPNTDPGTDQIDPAATDVKLNSRRKVLMKTNSAVAELLRLCRSCESSAASKKELEELKIQQMKEVHDIKMKILHTDLKIKEELLKNVKNGSVQLPDAVQFLEVHDT